MTENYPVVIFCYNRPEHLRRTIDALRQNRGASEAVVWFFSDGPASDKDSDAVRKVRDIIKNVDGFREVKVEKSEVNRGLATSVIKGVTKVLSESSACIVMEDDLETSPWFLDFMNKGLTAYADDPGVFSISGYCPPIAVPKDYSDDAFRFPRINSWGWGTWRDRWERIDWEVKDFDRFISDRAAVNQLSQQGKDLPVMLLKQQTGKIGSWAVRFNQACFREGKTNVYPVQSLVRNIGADGTGTHMDASGKYITSLSNEPLEPCPAYENALISRAFYRFYRPSVYRQIINKIKIGRYLQSIR